MAIQVTDMHMLRDQLMVRRQKLETATAKTQTANLLHCWNRLTTHWSVWTTAPMASVSIALELWSRNACLPIL